MNCVRALADGSSCVCVCVCFLACLYLSAYACISAGVLVLVLGASVRLGVHLPRVLRSCASVCVRVTVHTLTCVCLDVRVCAFVHMYALEMGFVVFLNHRDNSVCSVRLVSTELSEATSSHTLKPVVVG